jgi:bacteriorhodopsin
MIYHWLCGLCFDLFMKYTTTVVVELLQSLLRHVFFVVVVVVVVVVVISCWCILKSKLDSHRPEMCKNECCW